jgi:hypothetical protein
MLIQNVTRSLEKLTGNSTNLVSRQNSPLLNLRIFFEYPIFGAGYQNATNMYINMKSSINYVDSQTSTSTYQLAAIGILGIVFSFVLLLGICKQKNIGFLSKSLLVFSAFFIINVEPCNGILFYYVVLFFLTKQADIRLFAKYDYKKIHDL